MTAITGPIYQVEKLDETESLTGDTPLLPIHLPQQINQVELCAKLEYRQLGRSTQSRVAFAIVKSALLDGQLDQHKTLIDLADEAMAMAYGAICARLSIRLTLVMDEDIPHRILNLIKSLGAEILLSPSGQQQTMLEQHRAQEPGRFFFANHSQHEESWKVHYLGTAREIYHQTSGRITHFVADASQRSLLLGTGKKLKEVNRDVQLVALQLHSPEQNPSEMAYADQTIAVDASLVDDRIDAFAKESGLIISRKSAINLIGLERLAASLDEGVIVTVFPDDASL